MTETTGIKLDATYLGLREIGPWLGRVFVDFGWADSPSLGAVELAVHELATNVVDHADPPDGLIRVEAQRRQDDLAIRLTDAGRPFEQTDYAAPDENNPQERGYGLMIAEQLATEIEYFRDGDINVWSAVFAVEAVGG